MSKRKIRLLWNEAGQQNRESNRTRTLKLLYAYYTVYHREPMDAKDLIDAAKEGGVNRVRLNKNRIQRHLDQILH